MDLDDFEMSDEELKILKNKKFLFRNKIKQREILTISKETNVKKCKEEESKKERATDNYDPAVDYNTMDARAMGWKPRYLGKGLDIESLGRISNTEIIYKNNG